MSLQPAAVAAAALLAGGLLALRLIPALRRWAVPASVAGGLIGFALVQAALRLGPAPVAEAAGVVFEGLRPWPGPLLAVVFAAMLIAEPPAAEAKRPRAAREVTQQALMVWLIVLGQAAVGLAAVWALGRPDGVPAAFGQLIETGFSGGHGTAAAMGDLFAGPLDFPEGRDLGMLFATAGLLGGTLSGIALVNLGARRGWLSGSIGPREGSAPDAPTPPPAPADLPATTAPAVLAQLALVGVAFGIGWAVQAGFLAGFEAALSAVAGPEAVARTMGFVGNLPLFLFTLLGGLALRHLLRLTGLSGLADRAGLDLVAAVAIEFLIVAALATLRVEALWSHAAPVAVLLVLGFGWSLFCLLVLARRVLPAGHWFELGLVNYGMSTGTTAQGMMLLRMVDPAFRTPAARDYAAAAPFSAPFIGGGVVTLTLPLLLADDGGAVPLGLAVAALWAVLLALYLAARRLRGAT